MPGMECRCPDVEELDGAAAQDYVREHLEEIEVDKVQWEILYRCPVTAIEWLCDFPHSERHGGGPPRLRRLSVLMPRTSWPEPIWDDVRRGLSLAGAVDARDVVSAVVEFSVRTAFVGDSANDDALDPAIHALQSGQPSEMAANQARLIAEQYDQVGYDLRDQDEAAGNLSGGQAYRSAFEKARAASAVEAALRDDLPRALYEARHAIANDQSLSQRLASELQSR